jgi:hypothetical protein
LSEASRPACPRPMGLFARFVVLVCQPGALPWRSHGSNCIILGSATTLGKAPTGPSPSTTERSSDVTGPTLVRSDTPFDAYHNSRFSGRQPPVTDSQENVRPLTVPRIVVQDSSAEDGTTCCKTLEHDPTDTLKRRRRLSRSRASASLEDHLSVTARPSPTRGAASVTGGLRPLNQAEGLKGRRSDIFVQRFLGFPGGGRMVGDIVAKDGSFVIVGDYP